MSKITAIIPSLVDVDHNYLKVCVESLRSTVDWEIIVVANGTKDMAPFRDIDGITKGMVTRQQGQCNAVNRGVEKTEGDCEWLFISNSDMYYAPNWLKDTDTSEWPLVWSPNLVEPTNNPGSAKPFLKLDAGFTLEEFDAEKIDDFISSHKDRKTEAGFNLPFFIRKDVWLTIGGYDEKYDPWGSNSDTDLQTLVNLAGITPQRMRNNLVYHFSNKSGTFDGTHQEEWQKNFDYYTNKFGFNRDQLGSDVWYNKSMLPKNPEDIKFEVDWLGKYADS